MHSLNASPGRSAHSSVEDSGTAVRGAADTAVSPPPHPPEGIGDTVGGATTASLAGGGGAAGGVAGATPLRKSSNPARGIAPCGVLANRRVEIPQNATLGG